MKKVLFLLAAFCLSVAAQAQTGSKVATTKKLKVVFHLTSSDTTVQKSMAKQLNNFLNAAPNAKVEVVCHNSGISFLHKAKTKFADKVHDLSARGVDFVACENTMRDRNIKREELVDECRTVPAGVVEVVMKQNKGWAYVRATQ
ncbi:MAG: DsrE family protein [Saprospiraceae bacterium]